MKLVDLSGSAFHMDVTLLAIKRLRDDGATSTRFFTDRESGIIFEVRVVKIGGKPISARDAREVANVEKRQAQRGSAR